MCAEIGTCLFRCLVLELHRQQDVVAYAAHLADVDRGFHAAHSFAAVNTQFPQDLTVIPFIDIPQKFGHCHIGLFVLRKFVLHLCQHKIVRSQIFRQSRETEEPDGFVRVYNDKAFALRPFVVHPIGCQNPVLNSRIREFQLFRR